MHRFVIQVNLKSNLTISRMITIDYPDTHFRFKYTHGRRHIFDEFRKQFIALTGEEWVRQNFLQYLTRVKKYPPALVGVEKEFSLGELKKRCDIIVYNRQFKPWMLVECKTTEVILDEKALEQVLRYNLSLPVEYLVLTNGIYSLGYHRQGGRMEIIKEIPDWPLHG